MVIYDQQLKERLLNEPELTLLKAENMCHNAEIAQKQLKALSNNNMAASNLATMIDAVCMKAQTTRKLLS